MRVELQIRTNGMDFWATLEHQLRYKKGIEDLPGYAEISEELLRSAQAVSKRITKCSRLRIRLACFMIFKTGSIYIILRQTKLIVCRYFLAETLETFQFGTSILLLRNNIT